MMIDLHTHTNCSDGELSPEDLLHSACQAGVELMSITDHDVITAYEKLPGDPGLKLINGIELSALWRRMALHIVGLNIDLTHPELLALIDRQAEARHLRMEKIVQRLQKLGYQVDLNQIYQQCDSSMVGRPQLANYLVQSGQISSVQQAFKKVLGQGKPGDVKSFWPSLDEVVSVIQVAGGIAVLAHPLKYRLTRTKLADLVEDFIKADGRAMEVLCGRQIPSDTRQLEELCRSKGLLASVGSDFHRFSDYHSGLGMRYEPAAGIQLVWSQFD